MRTRFARATASVAVAGLALAGALVIDSGAAYAATIPPWQLAANGLSDPNQVGTLSLFDSAGNPVTNGLITDKPIFAYAVGSTVLRPGDTTATLYGALPKSGQAQAGFTTTPLGASTTYPVEGAPASVGTTLPVYTGSVNDYSISDLATNLPNTSTGGDKGLYEIRLRTGGHNESITQTYDAVDIAVSGSSWHVAFPVNPSASTTTLTTSTPSGTVDTAVTLTATIDPSSANGTVQFADGNTPIGGPVTVTNGVATTSWTPTTVSTHTLEAVFAPAVGETAEGSTGSASFVVGKAKSTLTGTWSTATPTYGKSYTVSAKVTAPGVTPTGTVTLLENGTSLVSGTLVNGKVTLTVGATKLAPGSYTEVLSYAGTSTIGSSAATKKVTIGAAASTTKITLSPTTVTPGTHSKVTITVAATGVTPTGTIDLYESAKGAKVAAVTLTAAEKGKVSVSLPLIAKLGTYSIHAKYLGSSKVKASTSASVKLKVVASASTTKISLSPTTVTTKKHTKVTITVTASGLKPTGTIYLYESATGAHVATVKLTAAEKGKVSVSLPLIGKAGTYSIHAKYLGSSVVKASTSASVKLTVKKA